MLYNEANMLVYQSIHEIFGLVSFEALMHGVPVIVSNDSGCEDLIRDWRCGLLVNFGDHLDLEQKITILLENPNIGKGFVRNGQKFIEGRLVRPKIVRVIEIRTLYMPQQSF
jgi:glycosyltransferase involved in cell wall biosynthesis